MFLTCSPTSNEKVPPPTSATAAAPMTGVIESGAESGVGSIGSRHPSVASRTLPAAHITRRLPVIRNKRAGLFFPRTVAVQHQTVSENLDRHDDVEIKIS